MLFIGVNGQTPDSLRYIGVSYLGNNIWNPGISLSMDNKIQAFKNLSFFNNSFIHIEANAHWDIGNRTLLATAIGWKKYRSSLKKWSRSFTLKPLGITRSFSPKTYTINENGNVEEPTGFEGRFYYNPSIEISILRKYKDAGYFRLAFEMSALYPYNYYTIPLIHLKVGYLFSYPCKKKNDE